MSHPLDPRPRVGLFVTCLVDLMRPSVGFAAVKLLEQAGCRVEVPAAQTCCGQPAYNSGDRADAARSRAADDRRLRGLRLRRRAVRLLRRHAEVALSGAARRRRRLAGQRALAFAERVHELISFLVDVRAMDGGRRRVRRPRHLPRQLLGPARARRQGAAARAAAHRQGPRAGRDGGQRGVLRLRRHLLPSNSPTSPTPWSRRKAATSPRPCRRLLLAGDLGCLMNMAGKMKREGRAIAVRHVAEVLAGELADPPIGEAG